VCRGRAHHAKRATLVHPGGRAPRRGIVLSNMVTVGIVARFSEFGGCVWHRESTVTGNVVVEKNKYT